MTFKISTIGWSLSAFLLPISFSPVFSSTVPHAATIGQRWHRKWYQKIMNISPGHFHNFSVIPSSVGHFRCEHCLRTNLHLYAGENKYFGIRGLFCNSHLMGPSTFMEIIWNYRSNSYSASLELFIIIFNLYIQLFSPVLPHFGIHHLFGFIPLGHCPWSSIAHLPFHEQNNSK